jgi:hypothetical protein
MALVVEAGSREKWLGRRVEGRSGQIDVDTACERMRD